MEHGKAPPRRIVQIVTASAENGLRETVYAVANDGTLWRLDPGFAWVSLPPLPNRPESQLEGPGDAALGGR